jgi:7-cyano-7-deazaguanine synthase in queuosine biosynthesis
MITDNESDTLLMFSGGLDSTGALWSLLKDKNLKLHIHHMHLVNKENRAAVEKQAVNNILSYINNISNNVVYSESYQRYSSYSYSTIMKNNNVTIHENAMFDSDMYNFMAGTICMCLPHIKRVAVGRTLSDDNQSVRKRSKRGNELLKLFAPDVEKIYPVEHLSKAEIYNMLPEDLRNLTWSCRTPIFLDKNTVKECGECATCLDIQKIKGL